MTDTRARKIRLIYGIALAVLTVIVGILFIFAAARIYGGRGETENPYSRQLVGEYLKWLIYPLILWILAIVGGYVLSVVFPVAEQTKAGRSAFASLKKLKKRIPQGESEEFYDEYKRFRKQELIRLIVWSVAAAFALAVSIVMIVYLASGYNFDMTADYLIEVDTALRPNAIIIRMVRYLLPWVAAALLLFIAASLYEHFSAKKELDTVKRLLVLGKGTPVREPSVPEQVSGAAAKVMDKWQVRLGIFAGLLVVAVAFIIIGALDGGIADTMAKAIALCRECVGIG